MKPITLTLCGWGPFRDKQTVDFTKVSEKGIFLITGQTGAGKTTIFDGITYALYGSMSGEIREKNSVRSDFADADTPTYAELTMMHNGLLYQIYRNPEYMRPKKRKNGGQAMTKEREKAVLTLPDGSVMEGSGEVTRKIQEILRLDYRQFKQISMIAQGEFARLLTASPGEKTRIFREIFDTALYDRFASVLRDEANTLYKEVMEYRHRMDEDVRQFHTEDEIWKELIGKTMNDFSLIPDQRFILDQLLAAAREEKADAFVIAGDVYDRAVPPGEAVQLLDSFLTSLLEEGIPVLLISGNHDSPERLGFGEEILQKQGLYIAGSFRTPLKKVTLQDAFGPVNFFLFPFVRPAVAGARTADEAVGAVLEEEGKEGRIDPGERNVLISHFFVTFQDKEPELSDAETTIHVGGIDNVDAGHFAPFDYVALGHIHKPQKIGPDNVWYAGAPLAYSFSECAHVKSINVVELGEKGKVTVNQRPLLPLHALRKAEGTLEELLKKGGEEGSRAEDYIQAILTNEEELVDPIGTLRSVYPNICQIILAKREKEARQTVKERHAIRRKSTAELFADFYGLVRGSEMDEARKKVTEETVKKVEQE